MTAKARAGWGVVVVLVSMVASLGSVERASARFVDTALSSSNTMATDQLEAPPALSAVGGSVYRASTSGGPYVEIATVTPRTALSYVDSPAEGLYYYVVRAYFQAWESGISPEGAALVISEFFLHNNPTPPVGATNAQTLLPLDGVDPTAATLENYDADRDAFAGLVVANGGLGPGETDPVKYQAWRTAPLGSAVSIEGTVTFHFYSAIKDFNTTKTGGVQVYVRSYDGASYTERCNGTLTQALWQGGSATWVLKSIALTCTGSIAAGHRLEVKILVGASSDDALWFAYDTTAYPSQLVLP